MYTRQQRLFKKLTPLLHLFYIYFLFKLLFKQGLAWKHCLKKSENS